MGNLDYIYVEERKLKRRSVYPGSIISINDEIRELRNLSNPDKKDILSKIHWTTGDNYMAENGYIVVDIGKSAANYVLSFQNGKDKKCKNRKIAKDLENIAKIRGNK
jgi:hypothetical protein